MRRRRGHFKGMQVVALLDATRLFMWIRPMNAQQTPVKQAGRAALLERLGKRSIVFVGLMGAGKTSIGRKVAACLGLPFVDSDHEIEDVSRMSIPELFEAYGEPEFRALEQRVIARILETGPKVLSTGGGAYMNEHTRAAIASHGVSVWLKADLDLLMERVSKKQNRPLLRDPDPRGVLGRLMDERYPVYAQADMTVVTRDETKEVIAAEVIEAIGRHMGLSGEVDA